MAIDCLAENTRRLPLSFRECAWRPSSSRSDTWPLDPYHRISRDFRATIARTSLHDRHLSTGTAVDARPQRYAGTVPAAATAAWTLHSHVG
jgi:hypothetical protein